VVAAQVDLIFVMVAAAMEVLAAAAVDPHIMYQALDQDVETAVAAGKPLIVVATQLPVILMLDTVALAAQTQAVVVAMVALATVPVALE
jgi:hypothetical protein